MQAHKVGLRQDGVTLVLAPICSAIAKEVLGGGDDMRVVQEVVGAEHTLQAFDDAG